jgi:aryl-alcohol dehydrogenase-like predicted oxidoreductase
LVQTINPGFSSRNLTRLVEVNRALSEIAKTHGKTPSQVALNWVTRRKNIVAIPGVKRTEHSTDDAGAVDWALSSSEIDRLEKVTADVRFDRLSVVPNLLRALAR